MIHSQQIALLLALAVSVASAGPSLAQQDATKAGVAETALPPSKTISLDTVGYDQTGKIVFSGRGPAGSKVQLNVDNNTYGLAVIDDKGAWTYAFLSPITVGTHTLRANEIGGDGTVKYRIQMLFYREEPDKVATARLTPATPEALKPAKAAADEKTKAVVEEAIEKGNDKLVEEADRVPGLTYDDISRLSSKIPGKVQIPDPTSEDFSSRAISVPGGLVSNECKHFARGFIAKRLMIEDANLGQKAAMAKVIGHLKEQRVTYAKLVAGKEGLKRSDVAIHDAKCPICGPLNAAEIACHKNVEKNSPIRELVRFDFASDKLRGGHAVATIQQIKTLLNQDPGLQVALIGRSSIPGGPVPNFALSAKRITSVWQGFDKAGVPIDRIVAIPIGEDEPHIDLQTAMDYGLEGDFAEFGQEPLNQSVNIVVFRPDKQAESEAPDVKLQGTPLQGDTLESKRKKIIQYLSGE